MCHCKFQSIVLFVYDESLRISLEYQLLFAKSNLTQYKMLSIL